LRRTASSKPRAEFTGSAPLFAALGDETRLRLVARLCDGGPMSIARLTEGFPITRQAITKHLRMMEDAGLVHSAQNGRESVWQLEPKRLDDAGRYLHEISTEWDHALIRLKRFVER
jgi:DNA-binding transcriptional ArsR family regulator